MKALQETTVWTKPNENTPNHIYITTDCKSKLIAYVNSLTGELKVFSRPGTFSTSRRTFKEIKDFDFSGITEQPGKQIGESCV